MAHYLEIEKVCKAFAGVQALKDISFRVESGQVCALVGENGAGKSTLLKVICGVLKADSGVCRLDGEELNFDGPMDAIQKGISVISQERQLVPHLSVMENIFMEDLPTKALGVVDTRKLEEDTQKIIDAFRIPIHPKDNVEDLSVAHQQMVEIMKAYRRDSAVIAFDEPTAPLSEGEIEALFEIIQRLKKEKKIVLYISHRLNELYQIADQIIVMRDGMFIKEVTPSEVTERQLITYMVGRDLGNIFENLDRNDNIGEVVLEVRGLTNLFIRDVSFQLHKGEILGLSGLVGAGRTETVRTIFGVDPLTSGQIFVNGEAAEIRDPYDAIGLGIALCPEDRKEEGLCLLSTIRENITMPFLKRVSNGWFINRVKECAVAEEAVENFRIKTPTIEKLAIELSGGNQQKVILGRWIAMSPTVLILDEPTKGIDAGAKAEIYQMVCNLAKSGIGVIFISSELTEVINICDRVVVMREGAVTGELERKDATEESVLSLAMIHT